MYIYYFSATGNSFKVAQDIALANEGTQLIPIRSHTHIEHHPHAHTVGFIFPVYMGVLPDIVKRFIESFPVRKGIYYFAVATYYTYKGIALSVVNQLLKNKGVRLSYGNTVSTVGTCLMEYEVSESKRKGILRRATDQTKIIVEDIRKSSDRKTSAGCSMAIRFHEKAFDFFFKDAHKKFGVEDRCVGCGLCSKACPVDNITIIAGKPTWGNHCQACHACVHWCPRNAIYLGRSKGRLTYHHPEVTLKQLSR